MALEVLRPPSVQKTQERPRAGVFASREQPSVKVLEGGVFALDEDRFLGPDAERERGLVPQKVRQRLTDAFDGTRNDETLRPGLLVGRVADVLDVHCFTGRGEDDGVRDVLPRKADGGRGPVVGETLVEADQRIQDRHARTSSASGGGHVDHAVAQGRTEEAGGHVVAVVDVVQHPAEILVTLVRRQFGSRHRVPHEREVGRELAGPQIGAMKTLPARRAAVEHGEMLGLRVSVAGGGQQEVRLDDVGHAAQQHRGSLLPIVLDEGPEARGRTGLDGLADAARRDLAAQFVAPEVLEADGLQDVNPVDHPADGRFPVNRLENPARGRGRQRVVGHPLDLHLRPGEAGVLAPDVQLHAVGHGDPPCEAEASGKTVICLSFRRGSTNVLV